MSTYAEHAAALAAELRPILARFGVADELSPENLSALVADLVTVMSGYTARKVEERAHPDYRFAPKRRERKTA